jgi:hypothetical protein
MGLATGFKLGPYEIVAPLGARGMGDEREAKSISSLKDPNICVLYDVGNQDGIEGGP